MKKIILVKLLFCFSLFTYAQIDSMPVQDSLPYYNIPEYPNDFSPGNVVSRMVDGLGYRYYWATKGLYFEDMDYKISEDSRTIKQTLNHIYRLSKTVDLVANNKPIVQTKDETEYTFEELRQMTLEHIASASQGIRGRSAKELSEQNIVFQRADKSSSFPFWNLLNGQLADAIYHTGQIVGYRRASGNPVDPRMNVFTGKTRN